jgi:flagellar protein FlaG
MSISPLNITTSGDAGAYAPAPAAGNRPDPIVSAGAPAATPQVKRSTEADVANAVDTLNSFAATTAAALNFSTDKESGKTIVKVVDTATDQLIRQIPSEEAIAISHSIDKMQGLLVNQKA